MENASWETVRKYDVMAHVNVGVPQEFAESVVETCLPSKREWGYRNKLEMGCVMDDKGLFTVGFHKEGSDELTGADSSRLVHKKIEKVPKALCGAIRYAQGSRDLGIHRIGVRHSFATGDLEVAIWTKPGPFPRALFATRLPASSAFSRSLARHAT